MMIADEVHHAGGGLKWGDALKEAFERSVARLLLSGTPFRSDNNAIPFVSYAEDSSGAWRSRADFTYGYGDALRDGVCRPVLFPSYEGTMEWTSGFEDRIATFRDEIPEREARRRLRTALDPNGEWLGTVLRDADQRLKEVRANGHPDAGGLVVCIDMAHAKRVAGILKKISHEEPTIVVSEDADASDRIKQYNKGNKRWLVAVKMVSEGVDIPRLRVGVYATTIISELTFRQIMGRLVRMMTDEGGNPSPEEQSAYLFVPREYQLITYAQRVKEERDHELAQEVEDVLGGKPGGNGGSKPTQTTLFAPIGAEARVDDVFFDHQAIPQSEISAAAALREQSGVVVDPVQIAHLFRLAGKPLVAEQAPCIQPEQEPVYAQKKKLRKLLKRLVAQLTQATDMDYSDVYTMLMQRDGVRNPDATEAQLKARVDLVKTWLEEARSGQITRS
jgi:superfamily II DNA or RNA helicase